MRMSTRTARQVVTKQQLGLDKKTVTQPLPQSRTGSPHRHSSGGHSVKIARDLPEHGFDWHPCTQRTQDLQPLPAAGIV
jgi:hypothetical protein